MQGECLESMKVGIRVMLPYIKEPQRLLANHQAGDRFSLTAQKTPAPQTPCSQTPSLQNWETMNFNCLCPPVSGAFTPAVANKYNTSVVFAASHCPRASPVSSGLLGSHGQLVSLTPGSFLPSLLGKSVGRASVAERLSFLPVPHFLLPQRCIPRP